MSAPSVRGLRLPNGEVTGVQDTFGKCWKRFERRRRIGSIAILTGIPTENEIIGTDVAMRILASAKIEEVQSCLRSSYPEWRLQEGYWYEVLPE